MLSFYVLENPAYISGVLHKTHKYSRHSECISRLEFISLESDRISQQIGVRSASKFNPSDLVPWHANIFPSKLTITYSPIEKLLHAFELSVMREVSANSKASTC